MTGETLPLIVLGGSDRKPAELPPGHGETPLSGCKGVDVRIGDRCLIELLIERLQDCGAFGPIYIAGPASVYEAAGVQVTVFDTDGGFGRNIQVGIERVLEHHPEGSIGMTTCDILPEVEELRRLMENYSAHAPSDLWFPLIKAPQDPTELGPSAWKPQYRIVPEPGQPAVPVLPGHLTVFDPHVFRLKFLYRLFDLGYQTRNRPVFRRRSYIVRQLLFSLLRHDFGNVLHLRAPTRTWDVLRAGYKASRLLKEGTITRAGLEDAMRQVFVKRPHRKRHRERRIQVPLMQGLSLARDIDTEEEAAALGGGVLSAS